jgi:hypothetical protein
MRSLVLFAMRMFRAASAGRCVLAAVAYAVSAVPFHVDAVEADTMRFRNECFANAVESCFVIAEGTLDRGAPERFDNLPWEQIEGIRPRKADLIASRSR